MLEDKLEQAEMVKRSQEMGEELTTSAILRDQRELSNQVCPREKKRNCVEIWKLGMF